MKRKLPVLFKGLVLSIGMVWSFQMHSQINYSSQFEDESNLGWDASEFYMTSYMPCSGNAGFAGEAYAFLGEMYTATTVSSSIGMSNAQPAVLSYQFRLMDAIGDPITDGEWGSFTIDYATSPSGPWTTVQTVNSSNYTATSDCTVKTAAFTPVGGSIFLRIVVSPAASDDSFLFVGLYIDDLTVVQESSCTTLPPNAAAAQTFCPGATIDNLVATGTAIQWYAAATGGEALPSGSLLVNGLTYYASQTVTCESGRTPVTVALNTVLADDPADVSGCGSYTLPTLSANNVYRTATGGAGSVVAAGTIITESTTLYVYAATASNPVCSDENSFTVTIFNAVVDDPTDVVSCGVYTLPALTNGAYHTAANGGGDVLPAGAVIADSTTLYVFAQAAGFGACSAESSFEVTISTVEPLEDRTFTVVLDENGGTTTLADYDFSAEGTVVWFPTEQAAIDHTPVLSVETEIPLGTTTYYVRQLVGECYSEPSTVTFTVTLDTESFDEASFMYYPNPVNHVLTIIYSQNIRQVSVFNLLGQQVSVKNIDNTSAQVDFDQLASETYVVKLQTDTAVKVFKVIKN